jgi:hypothetical protein
MFKLFQLVWWMCVHPLLWLLFGFNITNKTLVSSPVTCMMWLRNSSPSSWYHSKKSQSQSHSLCFVCTLEHFHNPPCTKLVIALPNCDNLVECMKFVEIYMTVLKLWSVVFHNTLVNTSNNIITHYTWPTTSLFSVNICSPIFEHSTPLSYSSFTH